MNFGLFLKSAREIWPITLICGVLLFCFHGLLAFLLPTYQKQFADQILAIPFVRNIISAILGSEISSQFGPDMFNAVPWVHPVVLGILWSHLIYCCTRVPAGELERGTADFTFTLPVSRWEVYRTESILTFAASFFITGLAATGNLIGGWQVETANVPNPGTLLIVLTNLLSLSAALGGFTFLVTAATAVRSRAISVTATVAVISFVLNYLSQFWSIAQRLSWASVLAYYRPIEILKTNHWPVADIVVLLALALTCWTAGGVVLSRRDLCTV